MRVNSRVGAFAALVILAGFSACTSILGIEEGIPPEDGICGTFRCTDGRCDYDYASAGTPCDPAGGFTKICDGSGNCKSAVLTPCSTDGECGSGICLNGECKATLGTPCKEPVECASNLCNEICQLQVLGECTSDAECYSNLCLNGICKFADGNGCESSIECSSNGCVGGVCRSSDGATCFFNTDCASGFCKTGQCAVSEEGACTVKSDCAVGDCYKMKCTTPSCKDLATSCGTTLNESCCTSILVPEGTFKRDNGFAYDATISDFRLDRFEVTVGRFRSFVTAYPDSRPMEFAGKHPKLGNGSGWQTGWNSQLPVDGAELEMRLSKCGATSTWTKSPAGPAENRPINCVDWYLAFAFCAWDGGRLPTEAEWNYVAAGGNLQREYPWSDPSSSTEITPKHASFECNGNGVSKDCGASDILPVGVNSPLGDGFWNHTDLAGNVAEWTLDGFNVTYPPGCNDCAETNYMLNPFRVIRGGSWFNFANALKTSQRESQLPTSQTQEEGIRCARDL